LGDGTTTNSSTPVVVSGLTGATAVTGGYGHTCAIVAGGAVDCWGNNSAGELGNGTNTNSSTSVAVTGVTGATAIAAGGSHTCAVLGVGSAVCWGDGWFGQLGTGTMHIYAYTPVAVSGVTDATAIAAGLVFSCAVVGGGSAVCWGKNSSGQLGNGYYLPDSATPVAVNGVTGATAIVGGAAYACAMVAGDEVHCWGANGAGQANGFTGTTAVDAGGAQTCAIVADGGVYCWGINTYGQLGNGTTINSATPVAVVWP
jgi:alpha-tubulin suppressor-like RCC1 family protein